MDALLETGWEGPAEEEPIALSNRSLERVQRILQALPERYRKVLICRFLLKLSLRDTAVSMRTTVATIKTLQFRALKRAANFEHLVVLRQGGAM